MIKSRRMRWSGNVARMGRKTNPYNTLVGKCERRIPLARHRRRRQDNIRLGLGEVVGKVYLGDR